MSMHVLLADDHTLFRHGLRRILEEHPEFTVVAEASTGLEAVELARAYKPEIVLLDIGMKELNGIAATEQIAAVSPRTAVIILSMHSDERYVVRALKAGARGYLLKDSVEEGLLEAIRQAYRGEYCFSQALVSYLRDQSVRDIKARPTDDCYELLTPREKQLYHLLAEGKCNKEIANRLNLSVHTVETHRTRIMEKLGVHGIAELVIAAVRRGDLLPY